MTNNAPIRASHRLLDIPEVVDVILGNLGEQDLFNCGEASALLMPWAERRLLRTAPAHEHYKYDDRERTLVRVMTLNVHNHCNPTGDLNHVWPGFCHCRPAPRRPAEVFPNLRTVIYDLPTLYYLSRPCDICASLKPAVRLVIPPPTTSIEMAREHRNIYEVGHLFEPLYTPDNIVVYLNHLVYNKRYSIAPFSQRVNRPPRHTDKTMKIVLLPFFWDIAGRYEDESFSSQTFIKSLIPVLVAYIIKNADRNITIVGLEDCNPFSPLQYWTERNIRAINRTADFFATLGAWLHAEPTPYFQGRAKADLKRAVKQANDRRVMMEGWTDEDKELVFSRVKLVPFKEYLESGEWRDELSHADVGRWLNALDGA